MSEPLEKYLARVERHLALMPSALKSEWLGEMRLHLDELIACHVAVGASPERAAVLAFELFGSPSRIGRAMFEEWQASLPPQSPLTWLVRFVVSSVWATLFYIGTALCIGFACGLYFCFSIMRGVSFATNNPATVQFFQQLNAGLTVATLFMAGLGLLLGLFGRLPGTRRRGAA